MKNTKRTKKKKPLTENDRFVRGSCFVEEDTGSATKLNLDGMSCKQP